MIGNKIRTLRRQLGLSQQQLAGSEMTREFISLVESGKSRPSSHNLRVIAERLGKPVAYFQAHDRESEADVIPGLLAGARQDLGKGGDAPLAAAERKLRLAIQYNGGLMNAGLDAEARCLLIRCLGRQGQYAAVLEEGDAALACCRAAGDRSRLARLYRDIGSAAHQLQAGTAARRALEQAVLHASGLKSLQEVRVEALILLGSTLVSLGDHQEAAQRFAEAVDSSGAPDQVQLRGRAEAGLAHALYGLGNLSVARERVQHALGHLRRPSVEWLGAERTLAVIELARGQWERAYSLLQECLTSCQAQGLLEPQAAVLKELAVYWSRRDRPDLADASCWEALRLLEGQDNPLLRGQLYRLLGGLAVESGRLRDARSYFSVSWDILRQRGAQAEARFSFEELRKIRHSTAAQDAKLGGLLAAEQPPPRSVRAGPPNGI